MSEKKTKKKSAKTPPSSDINSQKLAEIQISIAKKKECLAKAVETVKSLLENPNSEDFLIQSCQNLNQAFYKDVIEERAIEFQCGYPICCKPLTKVATKQKYHISLRYNKVFDITERKVSKPPFEVRGLCSSASKYLENQFPTCPLWLLDDERPSSYKLLSADEKCPDAGEIKLIQSGLKDELHEFRNEYDALLLKETNKASEKSADKNSEERDSVSEKLVEMEKLSVDVKATASDVKKRSRKSQIGEIRFTPCEVVEKILREWITLDTLKFIFGDERFEEFLADKGFQADTLEVAVGIAAQKDKQAIAEQYNMICRALVSQEIVDRAIDDEFLSEDQIGSTSQKGHLPSYESLAKDTANFSLNVSAFFQGKMQIAANASVTVKERVQPSSDAESEINSEYSVPLVDSKSQRALRRRIVMERFNSVSSQILSGVGLTAREINSDLKQLIHSFNLQANTITFKPAELTLLILFILKLLAIKDTKIRTALLENSSRNFIGIVLKAYQKDSSYLEHYCNSLLDVNTCVRNTNMAYNPS